MSNPTGFSVLGMVQEYADANNVNVDDLFRKPDPIKEESVEELKQVEKPKTNNDGWTPDASLLEGMEEFSGPVTYDKSEIKETEETELRNIVDDSAIEESRKSMDEMSRITANLEDAKKRHGISKLQVPPGLCQVRITTVASDTDYRRAQEGLDKIFEDMKEHYPEFILEWSDPSKNKQNVLNQNTGKIIDMPNRDNTNNVTREQVGLQDVVDPSESDYPVNIDKLEEDQVDDAPGIPMDESKADVQIVIDKTNLPEISWTADEIDKVKKARSVELNIVEEANIKFSQIEEVPENVFDKVLSKYTRKINDVVASLPASRYRATFFGLSYPEVLDLNNTRELVGIDIERKRWTICFEHMRNPSIGEWRSYVWYIDPETNKRVEVKDTSMLPEGITDYTEVSKFDDFLMHTSYLDLEYMLWQILCATTLDKEMLTITCHNLIGPKTECGHVYDWIYDPKELLIMESIDVAVLEEMKVTGEADTADKIRDNYNESLVHGNYTVELPSSGFKLIFGHISAYDYLNTVYGMMNDILDDIEDDPSVPVKFDNQLMLRSIKGVLIPKEDGSGYYRVSDPYKILKIIEKLDEFDWQVAQKVSNMSIKPYQFRYEIKGLKCPKCKKKSSAVITHISDLLFIIAQSLAIVNVTLKKQ